MDINYVAQLAHLALSDREKEQLGPQMSSIIEWIRSLERVSAEEVPPTSSAARHSQLLRADVPRSSLPIEEVVANAPDRNAPFFRVPLIIER